MIWKLANPQLRDLAVYEPGKPIEETASELGVHPEAIIKLASNENPLGPSPKAIDAMRAALENAQFYPDGGSFYLREALAAGIGFNPENIILGNESLLGASKALDRAEERLELAVAPSAGEGEPPAALGRLDARLWEWEARLRAADDLTASVERELAERAASVERWRALFARWEALLQQKESTIPLP